MNAASRLTTPAHRGSWFIGRRLECALAIVQAARWTCIRDDIVHMQLVAQAQASMSLSFQTQLHKTVAQAFLPVWSIPLQNQHRQECLCHAKSTQASAQSLLS